MSQFQLGYEHARQRLARSDPERMAERSGARRQEDGSLLVRCGGEDYVVTWPGGEVLRAGGAPASLWTAILILHYLVDASGQPEAGQWIAFQQLEGGPGYYGSFSGRVLRPFLAAFGPRPDALVPAARALGGEAVPMGDVAVRVPALPRIPIAYVLWRGDEEFAPSASVVFDASVSGYLDSEVLTVLAELTTRRLIAWLDNRGEGR